MNPPSHPNCRCCMVHRILAEELLELAEQVRFPRSLILSMPAMEGKQLARIKLALDLLDRPPSFKLRAIVEEWDQRRLVEELY